MIANVEEMFLANQVNHHNDLDPEDHQIKRSDYFSSFMVRERIL
jgi:hypothetical protein